MLAEDRTQPGLVNAACLCEIIVQHRARPTASDNELTRFRRMHALELVLAEGRLTRS